jgi:hypothetical protein
MGDTQRADPGVRRTAVAILGCAMAVGAILITVARWFRPEFEAWLEQDLSARLRLVAVVLAIVTSGPVLGLAGYCWHFGRRIVHAQRYPPPGLRLTRDTPVVTGPAAGRRGRLIQVFAGVLGLGALLLPFFLWRLVSILGAGAP